MTTFYFVRHGETKMNSQRVFQGFIDSELTEKGVIESQRLGEYLSNNNSFDKVYCSPLDRVRKTCQLLLESSKKEDEIIYDDRLKEFNFGCFEGESIDQSFKDYPKHFFNLYHRPSEYIPLQGGETMYNFIGRITSFWLDILRETNRKKNQHILIVSHGGVISAFLYLIEQKKIDDFWLTVPSSSVTIVTKTDGHSSFQVVGKFIKKGVDVL